jgi:outer membrane protein assembly factor BamB
MPLRSSSVTRHPAVAAAVVAVAAATPACVTTQPVDVDAAARLQAAPAGSYLSGAPLGLDSPEVINRRDFIYALDFDDTSRRLAFVHHVSTEMELTLTSLQPLQPLFQEKLNKSEFDNEDVVIDGDRVLVPSRQGLLRALSTQDGRKLVEVSLGEPLLRVATSKDGVYVGTADGRVLVFSRALAFVGEGKVHDDEVRGLAVLPDGRLVTASMDGHLEVHAVKPADKALVRLPVSSLPSGTQVFLAHIDGQRAVATARDARQPSTVITRAAVRRLGLQAPEAGGDRPVLTAEGERREPAIVVGEVRLRALSVAGVTAAVCDACVPAGVELVLGQDVLSRVRLVEDVAAGELVARAAVKEDGTPVDDAAVLTPGAVTVVTEREVVLPGPANDIDVAAGRVLVTFSHEKAERSYEVHERERKGDFPPPSPRSGAALVDVDSGAIVRRFVGQHMGFTVTGALSPDGRTVATGGWDRRVLVWNAETGEVVTERSFAWLIRRLRFSPDNRLLGVAAWTPVNALNEGDSEPALVLYPLALSSPTVVTP